MNLLSIEANIHYLGLFTAVLLFIAYTYKIYDDMPKKEDIPHKWLLIPAMTLDTVFNNIFGKHKGTISSLITARSILITFLISTSANLFCVLLILSNRPENFTIDISTINLFFSSYLIFLIFNFLGDLVSISFTRHVLYKVSKKNMRLRKYIFQDFIGIFLGYVTTVIPIIILMLLYIFNTNTETINYLKEIGFTGPIFIPFSLLIFSTTSSISTIFIILVGISIFSIAIPTFLFMLTIFLLHFVSSVNIKDNGIPSLVINFLKKQIMIITLISSFIILLKEWLK